MQAPDVLSHGEMFQEIQGAMWKKCIREDGNEVVLMLEVENVKKDDRPEPELIADQAKILAIYDMWGYKTTFRHAMSPTCHQFVYEVGKTVKGPIWGYPRFETAQRKWVGKYGASEDGRYIDLATSGGRQIL